MTGLVEKWNALPRAARWLAYLVVFVGLFFGAVQPLWNLVDRIGARAASLENALRRSKELSTADSSEGAVIASAQGSFGKPLMPGSSRLTPGAFGRVVDGILEGHLVQDRTVMERTVPMAQADADRLRAGKINRLILDVTFEAKQETVIAILADLERASEVAAVSRVRIDRTGMRDEEAQLVRATISPEAWIAVNPSGASEPAPQPRSTNPSESEVIP